MRLVGLLIIAWLGACSSVAAPSPPPEECVTIKLWSNGWHTNLALFADLFDETHPLRTMFPDARHFLIGWGERNFYIANDADVWDGLAAIVPPSSSVVQVIAGNAPVEEALWPGTEVVTLAISRSGANRLVQEISQTLAYDRSGAPIIIAPGRIPGASVFLAAQPGFHLFFMCNHWTARLLQEAGVPVHSWLAFSADGLVKAVRRTTLRSCPLP